MFKNRDVIKKCVVGFRLIKYVRSPLQNSEDGPDCERQYKFTSDILHVSGGRHARQHNRRIPSPPKSFLPTVMTTLQQLKARLARVL